MNMNSVSVGKTSRRRKREATTDAFVAAAEKIFGRKSYEGASMQDIAREAGCATGTLYLYFTNKEKLFNAVITRHSVAIAECLRQAFASSSNPLEQLRRKTEAILDYFAEHRVFFRIFYTAGPGGKIDLQSHLKDTPLREYQAFKQIQTEVVRKGQAQGCLRKDIPAEELVEFIHSVEVGTLARWSTGRHLPSRDEQLRILWGLQTHGLTGGKKDA
jgi:AcrR family transcriptional regulator